MLTIWEVSLPLEQLRQHSVYLYLEAELSLPTLLLREKLCVVDVLSPNLLISFLDLLRLLLLLFLALVGGTSMPRFLAFLVGQYTAASLVRRRFMGLRKTAWEEVWGWGFL